MVRHRSSKRCFSRIGVQCHDYATIQYEPARRSPANNSAEVGASMRGDETLQQRSLRRASRIGLLLGVLCIADGTVLLRQYVDSGYVELRKENIRVTGREALTLPLAAFGGGVVFIGFALYYWVKNRRQDQSP